MKAWFPRSGTCRTLEAAGQVERQRLLVKVRGEPVGAGSGEQGRPLLHSGHRPEFGPSPMYLLLKSVFSLFHIFFPLKTNNNVFGSLCLTNHRPYPRADFEADPLPGPWSVGVTFGGRPCRGTLGCLCHTPRDCIYVWSTFLSQPRGHTMPPDSGGHGDCGTPASWGHSWLDRHLHADTDGHTDASQGQTAISGLIWYNQVMDTDPEFPG